MSEDAMSADDLVVASPIGALTLRAAGNALIAIDFGTTPRTESSAPAQLVLQAAAEQLAAYFAGELLEFDLPLRPVGTPFESAVWNALQLVPYGETVTYGELARRLGRPGAARAVGRANALNPLPIVVPCHRVIGADGTLTGYAGGLGVKRALLELESASLRVKSAPATRPTGASSASDGRGSRSRQSLVRPGSLTLNGYY